jgi:asparagine synthase (glutamine-hydrolysing)
LFAGVRRLLPGHTLRWRDGAVEIQRYWDLSFARADGANRPERALIEEFDERFREAVRTHLMSDVPLGVFLSGGIDSASIAAVMSQLVAAPIKTFSVAFAEREANELGYARTVADAYRTEHHDVVVSPEEFFAALPTLVWHEDEPLAHPSSVALYFVARLATEHVKVVLTGEGADALFAGYDYLCEFKDADSLQAELVRSVEGLHNLNLQRCDRVTMAHAVEARVPFLDREVIEWALRVPAAVKIGRPEKRLLREAFDGWLPDELLWRDKAEFGDGSGARDVLSVEVSATVSDEEFEAERGAVDPPLRTKEEVAYYRVWREHLRGISPERTLSRFARA